MPHGLQFATMQFGVLGTVEGRRAGSAVALGPPQQRAVLAALLLEPNRTVSVERLVELLWDEEAPQTAVKNIQLYVHRLRRLFEADADTALITQAPGYLLRVDPYQVDLHRFRALVARASQVNEERAADLLRTALGLWRGPALADLTSPRLREIAVKLDEEHVAALEERLQVDLRLSRHAQCRAELTDLVAAYPLRETFRSLLMLAHYRCGHQAAALTAYANARRTLIDELGVEPTPALRELHDRILRQDPDLDLPVVAPGAGPIAAGVPVPAMLPRGVAGFVGRSTEMDQLDATLTATAADHGPVLAIVGPAGVGKTALAVHWVRRRRDFFPDGQLFVDLRGHHPYQRPLEVTDALRLLLVALGVDNAAVPHELDEQIGRYRSLLSGRCAVVVLDNATGPEQVRPLLPGEPMCTVVVTARASLAGLVALEGAGRMRLDVLPSDDAVSLLAAVAGAEPVAHAPSAALAVADLCGRLPLALRIAAARLAMDPAQSLTGLAQSLAKVDRLGTLRVPGDQRASVQATFDLSYDTLDVASQRSFRLVGLTPGADVSVGAVAAMAADAPDAVRRDLEALAAVNLLEPNGTDRYRAHDLIRLYAARRARREDGPEARATVLDRLMTWYLAAATAAADAAELPTFLPLPAAQAGPAIDDTYPEIEFPDASAAMEWLEVELHNMVATIAYVANRDVVPGSWRLAHALRAFFRLRRYGAEWETTTVAALGSAQRAGDGTGVVAMRHSLAHQRWSLGRYEDALAEYGRALLGSRELGWRQAEAATLSAMGAACHEMGRHTDAVAHFGQALALCRELGLDDLETLTVGSLGLAYHSAGDVAMAVDCYQQVLEIAQRRGSRDWQATSLGNLGLAHHDLGELARAQDDLTRALALYRQIGSPNGEANVLGELSLVLSDQGRNERAMRLARRALRIALDIGDRRIEVDSRTALGTVLRRVGRLESAAAELTSAVHVAGEARYGRGGLPAMVELALTHADLDAGPAAQEWAEHALRESIDTAYRPAEGWARAALAEVLMLRGDFAAAAEHARLAVDIQQASGRRLDTARARDILGRALAAG
jgi:DNA-binding SARP family transcriptional activator/tetratricopeptide (TPR) repeat protein